ncbi:Double homeobox protein A [Myotis davidii]|uniref:Double homeobox protein A n=1 Tax=Myotis davidii TaxID=225400 RepID=L5LFF2_MYODS|nr:Double homeobox protein A [Myotis davidii]
MPNLKNKSSTRFTASRVYTLLMVFASNQYSGIEFREKLAKEVGVSESTVQIWFKNLRSKFTKNKPEESSERTRNQEQDPLTGAHPSVPSQVQELPSSFPKSPDQMDERGSQGRPSTQNTPSSPRLPSSRMQSPQSPLPPNGQDTRRPTERMGETINDERISPPPPVWAPTGYVLAMGMEPAPFGAHEAA